jgi:two-component system, NarL family, response regulator LiaR
MSEIINQKRSLRVLIAEDHELTKIGLVHSLGKSEFITVVGDAEDGQEAVQKTLSLKPDIVLMDFGMPIMDGVQATKKIKEILPETKIVILTSHKNQNEILAALTSGANAYCLKDIKPERLIQALESVMEGVLWIDPSIANVIVGIISQDRKEKNEIVVETNEGNLKYKITPRELEVLEYLAEGQANKEIAENMNISIYTVKRHISGIIEKLAVLDRTQAALKALRIGLVKNK